MRVHCVILISLNVQREREGAREAFGFIRRRAVGVAVSPSNNLPSESERKRNGENFFNKLLLISLIRCHRRTVDTPTNNKFAPFSVYLRLLRSLGHSSYISSTLLLAVTGA